MNGEFAIRTEDGTEAEYSSRPINWELEQTLSLIHI